MGDRLGMEAKLYYKPGGLAGGGGWAELTNVKDVTTNIERGEADVTTRANQGYRATRGTLIDASIEFEMVWDTEDPGFGALSDAFFDATPIGLKILDGENGTGLIADFAVTKFSRTEALEEAIGVAVTLKITRSTIPPTWQKAS
jgi:hypothetical protein